MSEDDGSEKQFEASRKKLEDARAKGETVKSTDLNTAASYGGLAIVVFAIGGVTLSNLGGDLASLIDQADEISVVIFSGNPTPLVGGVILSTMTNMAGWFLIPALMVLVSLIGQQAIVVAPDKLRPKLSRISPISGLKNKFGRQGLFEFAKATTKLVIYCVVLAFYLRGKVDRIMLTMSLSPKQILIELGRLSSALMLIVLGVATTLGIIDFVWQYLEHHRKNRMTRKEMMDEMKQSEGDPKLKQQRRQKGISIAMNQMLSDVPTADVIVVNPTHYAVALKWDRNSIGAPVCVAKGVDEIAARIRELAAENSIPIHSDPPTARSLFATVDVGEEISPEHYSVVATAIRFAESLRGKVRNA